MNKRSQVLVKKTDTRKEKTYILLSSGIKRQIRTKTAKVLRMHACRRGGAFFKGKGDGAKLGKRISRHEEKKCNNRLFKGAADNSDLHTSSGRLSKNSSDSIVGRRQNRAPLHRNTALKKNQGEKLGKG